VMLQALAAESGGRQAQAQARPEQMQEVMNNSLVATLSADVAREESRMKELNSRLGDSHPQVQEGRARLAELQSRLQGATSSASGGVVINNSVNKTRVAQIKSSLDSQRSKVIQLKSVRDEAAVLQRDVENAQRAYDAMTQRVTQAGVESQTTQTNVSIIKRASPPNTPTSPNLRRNLLIAVFVGTLLAVGFALAREFMDRRLRTEGDILAELKQPLLVVLPLAKHSAQKRETSRMRMLKARVMSGQITGAAVKVPTPK
jgi:polysaccharide biosynthesis transport protein